MRRDRSSDRNGAPRSRRASIARFASNPSLRFVVLFLAYLGIEALTYPYVKQRYTFLVKWMILGTARVEYEILRLFSSDVGLADRVVTYAGFPVKIIEECTGIYEVLIFAAAVLAFPTGWKKKALGFALGAPLIYLLNVVRILLLIVVGRYHHASFEFMHLYFWQATMIAMITSIWLLWIVKVVRYEKAALPPPA
ncbi:MAG: exosortase H [Myxococcales bacterium]|nr:exosortase H [Myxococcales bacterium]